MVVLGFFAGNDFFDGSPHRKRIVVNDTPIGIDPADEIVVFEYLVLPRSRFLAFVRQKWLVAKEASPRQVAVRKCRAYAEAQSLVGPRDRPGMWREINVFRV